MRNLHKINKEGTYLSNVIIFVCTDFFYLIFANNILSLSVIELIKYAAMIKMVPLRSPPGFFLFRIKMSDVGIMVKYISDSSQNFLQVFVIWSIIFFELLRFKVKQRIKFWAFWGENSQNDFEIKWSIKADQNLDL